MLVIHFFLPEELNSDYGLAIGPQHVISEEVEQDGVEPMHPDSDSERNLLKEEDISFWVLLSDNICL